MIRMSKQHANLNFEGVRSEILPNYRYEHFERGITLYEKMHLNYQSCVFVDRGALRPVSTVILHVYNE